jgi:hypothetical protein
VVNGARERLLIIATLGTTQTLAWGSSYYLLAILADPIARDLQITTTNVFAAFSVSLLLSALVGPRIGRTIDRFGGREVLPVRTCCLRAASHSSRSPRSKW